MKKVISVLLLLCMLTVLLALPEQAEGETIQVGALTGPTAMGMVKLLADGEGTYEPTILGAADELMPLILQGKVDIASVPANLASTIYNKTEGGVQVLAVNVLGVLYISEFNTQELNSLEDLKGKTIYSTGQGANPEYVLRHLLTKNGLDPDKDVTIEFVAENTELATLLATNKATVALVPQPVATTAMLNNKSLRVALDVSTLWRDITTDGSQPVMGCLIAKASTVEAYPQTIAAFLNEYKASIEAANTDVEKTAGYCETYGIIAKAAVAKAAIPNCALQFTAGADMQKVLQGYYEVLFAANPQAVGGAVPEASFYYVP